jgi:phenylpyruvate tautomerase PptA (4-oxalocrotonate tautomerase family)
MPFIHIKSLPLKDSHDVPEAIQHLSKQFAMRHGIDERHVTVTWEYFEPKLYLFGGVTGRQFDPGRHQILVDLLVPDAQDAAAVKRMMTSIVSLLTEILHLPEKSIFINTRYARSGMVMDAGEIVQW